MAGLKVGRPNGGDSRRSVSIALLLWPTQQRIGTVRWNTERERAEDYRAGLTAAEFEYRRPPL